MRVARMGQPPGNAGAARVPATAITGPAARSALMSQAVATQAVLGPRVINAFAKTDHGRAYAAALGPP